MIEDVEHFRSSITIGFDGLDRYGFHDSMGAITGFSELVLPVTELAIDDTGLMFLVLAENADLVGASDGVELMIEGYSKPVKIEHKVTSGFTAYTRVDDGLLVKNDTELAQYFINNVGNTLKVQMILSKAYDGNNFPSGDDNCINIDGIDPRNGNLPV